VRAFLTSLLVLGTAFAAGCHTCEDPRQNAIAMCPCGYENPNPPVKDPDGCDIVLCAMCPDNDMGMPDAPSSTAGCESIAACLKACGSTSCEETCLSQANPIDLSKFHAVLDCGIAYCGEAGADGGSPRCQKVGEVYEDAPGAPAGSCQQCLDDALAPLFGQPCSSMSSPDCRPAACKNTRPACGVG
jgi:hypothetical protein